VAGLRGGALVLLIVAPLLGGCRNAFRSFGTDGSAIQANADELFGALTARYSAVARDPKYEHARNRLNRYALVPSKIFDDTTVWTGVSAASARLLLVEGGAQEGRYVLAARTEVPRPVRPGDSRHLMSLVRLSPDEYVWDTDVTFSLGDFPPAIMSALVAGLLASPEGRAEPQIRADYLGVAPRATAALGSLFSMDSIRTTPFGDGSTDVRVTIGLHADRLKQRYPAFSSYVAKYLNPARYRLSLSDRAGAVWFDLTGADRSLQLHYRSKNGKLAPLFGPARERPDTMQLRVDFNTKFKLFGVGFKNLVGDLVITTTPHEQAWTLAWRQEPHWELPLITEKLLRSPLKRPFEGAGVSFHIGLRGGADGPTLLERRAHGVVQESAILRFINALGSGAMSDLADKTERDEEQFFREILTALHADARAVGHGLGAVAEEKTNAANP
jgi:hypothetical protein